MEIADFTSDLGLVALLTDFRTAHDPTIARLSYVFRKKAEVVGIPQSSEDCEFIVFGGGDEARSVPSKVRRRIAIDMLDALRDAEGTARLMAQLAASSSAGGGNRRHQPHGS